MLSTRADKLGGEFPLILSLRVKKAEIDGEIPLIDSKNSKIADFDMYKRKKSPY